MRISDWSSDVCSSDLQAAVVAVDPVVVNAGEARGAAALGQHHLIAAMGADIVERLNSVIAAARHHDRRVPDLDGLRSEERRGGKECVSKCRSRWSTYP